MKNEEITKPSKQRHERVHSCEDKQTWFRGGDKKDYILHEMMLQKHHEKLYNIIDTDKNMLNVRVLLNKKRLSVLRLCVLLTLTVGDKKLL